MTPERYRQVGQLYHAALELEPEKRAAFLEGACSGDDELCREVESLLQAHQRAGDFFAASPLEMAAGLFANQQAPSLARRSISHYQILSLIGAGGMGQVYLAQDTQLGRKVALKLLPKEFTQDQERVRRFEQEARAASSLNHPNIITIFEIGQAEERHFIATEYVEGQTLRQRITGGPMPLGAALDVAIQTASALSVAHEAGIVHRDIKPENIMVRRDSLVKVLDFGLVKLIERQRQTSVAPTGVGAKTLPGVVMGTVTYMSPEQAKGDEVDGRSDVFSLGIVLYEMVAGRPPFEGTTNAEVIAAILQREPSPLARYAPEVPAELERIITRVLRKDRDERYQAIKDLLLDLKSLKRRLEFDAELGRARTDSGQAASRSSDLRQKQAKRSRVFLPLALLTVISIGVIAGVSLIPWGGHSPGAPERHAAGSSERLLSYSLTVQKDPRRYPGSKPFVLPGEIIFEVGYQVRLNITSPQAGYLYIINEGPVGTNGLPDFNVLFPEVDTNNGSASVAAGHMTQIPQSSGHSEQDWFLFDQEEGTEKIWLIWSERSTPELEAVKGRANPKDRGVISDPNQIRTVAQYLAHHSAAKPESEKDEVNKQTTLKVKGEVLVGLVKLEHR